MNPYLEKVIIVIIGALVSALLGWLGAQILKYKKLVKKEEDEIVKKTITDSLSPLQTSIDNLSTNVGTIQTDVANMKSDISKLQNSEINFSTRLNPMQDEIEHLKDDIQEVLDSIKEQGIDINNIKEKEKHLEHETRCAWRYRIRTLCHVYIRRGWMTHDEFEQLQEMFNLYTAIGGNGQTKELYERTMRLDVLTDAEVAALEEDNKKQGA